LQHGVDGCPVKKLRQSYSAREEAIAIAVSLVVSIVKVVVIITVVTISTAPVVNVLAVSAIASIVVSLQPRITSHAHRIKA
jgi:hypothetical protein